MLIFYVISEILASKAKVTFKTDQIEEKSTDIDKPNPIQSLSFDIVDDSFEALLTLDRNIDKNNVNLMRTTNPDDANSYIIASDLSGDVKRISRNKWRIRLDSVDFDGKDIIYSIQIRENNNIYQTEPFFYDSKSNSFKLLREKSESTSIFTPVNIAYGCLAIVLGLILAVVVYRFLCKK